MSNLIVNVTEKCLYIHEEGMEISERGDEYVSKTA